MGKTSSLVQKHLIKRSVLSYLLYPLSVPNYLVQVLRRKYIKALPSNGRAKILSVGNIVCGGSGKTPVTIALAKALAARGFRVAVSHRGYKGQLENRPQLISDRKGLISGLPGSGESPYELAGDEAMLLAKELKGIPVVVGKARRQAIRIVNTHFPDTDIIILDDSFQHLKVKHDADVIVFSDEVGIGNGFLLPAGYLREPLSSIKPEHIVIINCKRQRDTNSTRNTGFNRSVLPDSSGCAVNALDSRSKSGMTEKVGGLDSRSKSGMTERVGGLDSRSKSGMTELRTGFKQVFQARSAITEFISGTGHSLVIELLKQHPVLLVSGIAFPDSFEEMIRELGIEIFQHIKYPDHYKYSRKDVLDWISLIQNKELKYIMTTAKDSVKLLRYKELESVLVTAQLQTEFDEKEKLISLIIGSLGLIHA